MKQSMWAWHDTLRDFLSHANEDSRYEAMLRDVFAKCGERFCKQRCFKWVEIGPGFGSKTAKILSIILDYIPPETVEIHLVEPDRRWHRELKDVLMTQGLQERSIHVWQENVEAFASKEQVTDVNLLTAIQVLYDDSADKGVAAILDVALDRSSSLVVVGVEARSSDTHQIREKLAEKGRLCPSAEVRETSAVLKRSCRSWNDVCLDGMYMTIRDEKNEVMQWVVPFLLGRDAGSSEDEDMNGEVMQLLEGQRRLRIPDRVLVGWNC